MTGMAMGRFRRTRHATVVVVVIVVAAAYAFLVRVSFALVEDNSKRDVSGRIFHGSMAKNGQFPFMAFLIVKIYGEEAYCGCALVTSMWVLTSGHCVFTGERVAAPSEVKVVAGGVSIQRYVFKSKRYTGEQLQEMDTLQVIPHPDYTKNKSCVLSDIALIQLLDCFDPPVREMGLTTMKPTTLADCTVIGWGFTDVRKFDGNLHYADGLNYNALDRCTYLTESFPILCFPSAAADLCMGDSGSPLVCDGMIWGIASCSHSSDDYCTDGEAYFTDVYYHLDWINSTMMAFANAGKPTCGMICAVVTLLSCIDVYRTK